MTTFAIVGSRHWTDYAAFVEIVERHIPPGVTRIVSGGARGVDTMAISFAIERGLAYTVHWIEEGEPFRAAAHARNQQIVDAADGGLALPGPKSKGTYDTIRRAKAGPNANRWTVVKVPE